MIRAGILGLALLALQASAPAAALADEGDTAIVVKRNAHLDTEHDFEVTSGTDTVSGDPTAGKKDAYTSWKSACSDWKKEMREMNHDNGVIALSCGTAKVRADESANGLYTYESPASYKIRVRVRGNGPTSSGKSGTK